MNKLLLCLVGLSISALSVSCKHEPDPVDPTPINKPDTITTGSAGASTPVGTPEGTALTATIGPAGGLIESADKRIQVVIPAGALATSQTISVQPITNQCPAGTGQAFRLTPHGLTFAKPATITYQYDEQDVSGSLPQALRIAYQDGKGSWRSPAVKTVDTTAHTVSVQTTHFSDWGAFRTMAISPYSEIVDPGEKVHLTIYFTIPQTAMGPVDDLIVPLPSKIDAKYVTKWTLAGAGTLTHQYSQGDYYAPAQIPTTNPAAVTVFLNKSIVIDGQTFNDLRLVANVFVAPEGISVQLDGGAWRTYPGGANINSTQNVILGKSGAEAVSVGWVGNPTGTYHWTKGPQVAFNISTGVKIYQHLYGTGPSVSGGSLRVDNGDETWVVGTFTVQPAGWIQPNNPYDPIGTSTVAGVFRMRRVGQ